MVEVNSETDFVARNEDFQELVRDDRRAGAARPAAISIACCRRRVPASGRSVADEITQTIAVIGENMSLRRVAAIEVGEGVVGSYVHGALAPGLGKIGVLVGLQSAGDPEQLGGARQAARDACRGGQAASRSASIGSMPAQLERERAIYAEQARATGKPDSIVDKIVDGRMRKFYEEVVLLEQAFVIDPDLKVKAAIERLAEKHRQHDHGHRLRALRPGRGPRAEDVQSRRGGRRSWRTHEPPAAQLAVSRAAAAS